MALTAPRASRPPSSGRKFSAGVALITPWMAAGTFFAGFRAHFLDHAFQLGRRPSLQIWVTCVAAIVATGFSFYLIPRWARWARRSRSPSAMAVSCCHAAMAGRWAYPIPLPLGAAPRIALSCALMAIAVHALPGRGFSRAGGRRSPSVCSSTGSQLRRSICWICEAGRSSSCRAVCGGGPGEGAPSTLMPRRQLCAAWLRRSPACLRALAWRRPRTLSCRRLRPPTRSDGDPYPRRRAMAMPGALADCTVTEAVSAFAREARCVVGRERSPVPATGQLPKGLIFTLSPSATGASRLARPISRAADKPFQLTIACAAQGS